MSYFKAKMHQIRFRLGLCPSPAVGAYRPLAGFKGAFTSKGRGREGRTREGRGRGRNGEGREKGSEGIVEGGARGRRLGIAHPLFSA